VTCPKCGYILGDFDAATPDGTSGECPRCAAREPQPGDRVAWEEQAVTSTAHETGLDAEAARRLLVAFRWSAQEAVRSYRARSVGPTFATATCERCRYTWTLDPPLSAGSPVMCPSCQAHVTLPRRNQRRLGSRAGWAVLAAVGATLVMAWQCCGARELNTTSREPAQPTASDQQPSAPVVSYPSGGTYQAAGDCPQGGNHVPRKADGNGRVYCARCGRYMGGSAPSSQPPAASYQKQPSASYQQQAPPATSYRQPQTYRQQGNCPQGGNHVPGKVDRNGRTHCARCGRFV